MAKYQANPVIVEAFKIVGVAEKVNADGSLNICLDNGENEIATSGMVSRMIPVAGDYWVIQEDGYSYLNPKAVFERKYHPVELDALQLGAAVRAAGLQGD